MHRKDVIDQELQAALALVFVDIQSINEVHSTRGGDKAVALFDVIKGNCIERAPCSWDFNPHFQVTVADDAGISNIENAVKARLGE